MRGGMRKHTCSWKTEGRQVERGRGWHRMREEKGGQAGQVRRRAQLILAEGLLQARHCSHVFTQTSGLNSWECPLRKVPLLDLLHRTGLLAAKGQVAWLRPRAGVWEMPTASLQSRTPHQNRFSLRAAFRVAGKAGSRWKVLASVEQGRTGK